MKSDAAARIGAIMSAVGVSLSWFGAKSHHDKDDTPQHIVALLKEKRLAKQRRKAAKRLLDAQSL